MRAATRLALFGVRLVAVFAAAAAAANALAPDDAATAWTQTGEDDTMRDHTNTGPSHALGGFSLEQHGYVLDTVSVPERTGKRGDLSFRILAPEGDVMTDFNADHEKDLHLIVVRTDGAQFRHVHPTRDESGTWTIPWEWDAAGSYRVYADFRANGDHGPLPVTLSRTVQVAGEYTPIEPDPASTATVAGFEVTVTGELEVGSISQLTLSVSRQGEAVTTLEPYLGALGHLVALRAGDLGYLHMHPEGRAPGLGDTSGPEVTFVAEPPTAGLYLLYFDFQVNGTVHTAALALPAKRTESSGDPHQEIDH